MEPFPGLSRTSSRVAELELAECWATFVKSLAIYPATNARVREQLERVAAAFDEVLAKQPAESRGRVRLRLSRRELRVNEQSFEPSKHSNLSWLRERLERALLAGIDLAAPLAADELTRFSRQLLDHFTRKALDATFERFWTETYAGVQPVPLRFDGTFAKAGPAGTSDDAAAPDDADVDAAVEVSGERDLEALLLCDVGVAAHLERLRQTLRPAGAPAPSETVELDLLPRIIRALPREALQDFERVVRVVTETLDALEGRVRLGQSLSIASGDGNLSRLLLATSHRLFGREEGPTTRGLVERVLAESTGGEPAPDAPAPQPRADDSQITDDVDLLIAELEALPRLDAPRAVAELELAAEQANAYLTFLARTEDAKRQATIHRALEKILAAATPASLDVLASHLAAHDRDDDAAREAMPRIEHFLRVKSLAPLARKCGFLRTEAIVGKFPRRFVLFLLSIDYSIPHEASLAHEVCRRVGFARIREAGRALIEEEKLLQWGLPERLFAHPSAAIAPLVRVILAEGGDEHVAGVSKYILTTAGSDQASCLLTVFEDATSLPRKYLDELLVRVEAAADAAAPKSAGGSSDVPGELSGFISRQLCRFLRETEDDPAATERRAYAVRFLATFRSPEGRQVLRRIVRRRAMLLAPREPRIVRRAAKRALWCY